MNNRTINISDFYYAVIEGEDERGEPIYGEPIKLIDNEEEY